MKMQVFCKALLAAQFKILEVVHNFGNPYSVQAGVDVAKKALQADKFGFAQLACIHEPTAEQPKLFLDRE